MCKSSKQIVILTALAVLLLASCKKTESTASYQRIKPVRHDIPKEGQISEDEIFDVAEQIFKDYQISDEEITSMEPLYGEWKGYVIFEDIKRKPDYDQWFVDVTVKNGDRYYLKIGADTGKFFSWSQTEPNFAEEEEAVQKSLSEESIIQVVKDYIKELPLEKKDLVTVTDFESRKGDGTNPYLYITVVISGNSYCTVRILKEDTTIRGFWLEDTQ